jgi:hypothetical protein
VQEGKLAHANLPPWWDDFQDALVLVQEGNLACATFPHSGIMLSEMCL